MSINWLLGAFVAFQLVAAGCSPAHDKYQAGTELLPAPTGPHATGRVSFHWKDEAREELETKRAGDRRELMVHIFYPADANAKGARAVYVPDAEVMRGPWNDEQLKRIDAMRAFSVEGAALPEGDGTYPVAIFVPGGGMKGLTYHTLLEDLASHGWVVAAIDPPYNARGVRFPDGKVLGNLRPGERGWPQTGNAGEQRRFYIERIAHWSRDVSFVIDQLEELERGDGMFAKRLDLARGVGVFGHSRGGQAAGAVRVLDARVRGGVNLDGATEYAILPVAGEDVSGSQPFLWIQRPVPEPPSDERLKRAGRTRAEYDAEVERVLGQWRRQLESVSGGAVWVTFDRPGITHIDFSDEPFWDGSMTAETRPGKLETIAATRAWVRAFFDGAVRGEWEPLEKLAGPDGEPGQGVSVQRFGRMWPN
jgi:hypothetical protein